MPGGDQAAFDVDVAVVGGGPGGLATAAAVLSAFKGAVTVRVFESFRRYKLQGSGVLMHANVQNALEAIHPDLLKKCKEKGVTGAGTELIDEDGTLVASFPAGERGNMRALIEKYGRDPFIIGWHEIRHLLFDYLPEGTVQFGKQMSHYEEDEEGVTAYFGDGHAPVRAKLLVGADGYFSKVRSQCLDDGPPDFVGSVMWRARIGWREGMPHPKDGPSRLYGKPWPLDINKRFGMLFKMGTLPETEDRPWSWVLSAPVEFVTDAGIDFDPEVRSIKSVQGESEGKTSALENAAKVFADFPASLMDVVRSTDPSTVTQHGLYMRPLGFNPLFTRHHKPAPKSGDDLEGSAEALDPTEKVAKLKLAQKTSQREKAKQILHESSAEASKDLLQENLNENVPIKTDAESHAQQNGAAKQPVVLGSKPNGETSGQAASDRHSADRAGTQNGQQSTETRPTAASDSTETDGQVRDVAWGKGRVTLLGDAAHATIPNGQGLCLTVEDAVVLGWHLKQHGVTQSALRSYEKERPTRVKVIHAKANDNATPEDRERYVFKPNFKPLWQDSAVPQSQGSADSDSCIVDF